MWKMYRWVFTAWFFVFAAPGCGDGARLDAAEAAAQAAESPERRELRERMTRAQRDSCVARSRCAMPLESAERYCDTYEYAASATFSTECGERIADYGFCVPRHYVCGVISGESPCGEKYEAMNEACAGAWPQTSRRKLPAAAKRVFAQYSELLETCGYLGVWDEDDLSRAWIASSTVMCRPRIRRYANCLAKVQDCSEVRALCKEAEMAAQDACLLGW